VLVIIVNYVNNNNNYVNNVMLWF